MDEYTIQITLFFPTQINGRTHKHLRVENHLLIDTTLIKQTVVPFFHPNHIAVHHHAVLIIGEALEGIKRHIEQDGEFMMSVQRQSLVELLGMRR